MNNTNCDETVVSPLGVTHSDVAVLAGIRIDHPRIPQFPFQSLVMTGYWGGAQSKSRHYEQTAAEAGPAVAEIERIKMHPQDLRSASFLLRYCAASAISCSSYFPLHLSLIILNVLRCLLIVFGKEQT